MSSTFLEPGGDATYGFEFWSSTSGTPTIASSPVVDGVRAIKYDSGAGGAQVYCVKTGVLADAGRRISSYFYFSNFPNATTPILTLSIDSISINISIQITSTGILQLWRSLVAQLGSNGSTLSLSTWYRLGLSYKITSASVNDFRVYLQPLNGSSALDITAHDQASITTGTTNLLLGWKASAVSTNRVCYTKHIYIDDTADLSDIGDRRVTAKQPAAVNTNNFDTLIGSATNRWDYVSDRALSESQGIQHAGTSDVQENFALQTAAQGDVDITYGTLIARTAWVWAKRGAITTITQVGIGTEGSAANGNITLGAPTSPATNDIWIACVHSSDQVAHTFTDWTEIVQGNGGGTTSRLSVWYFRYAGSTPNLIVTHTGGQSPVGGIMAFRGCKTSGSPVNVAGAINAATSTNMFHLPITPTVQSCALLVINGSADDNNRSHSLGADFATAFTDSVTGDLAYVTTAGNPDGSVSCFYDLDVPAADTGTMTVTQQASDPYAAVLIALEPAETVGTPKLMDNGSETTITLTTTAALYTQITDSASYPSNAAGIGMRSSASAADTYLYECGTLIAYVPGTAPAGGLPKGSLALLGVGR